MQLVLFEPDIPQNTGSLIRLAACTNVPLHIIEPCGFPFDDKRLRRVSMDYHDLAGVTRHLSWKAFLEYRKTQPGKLVLLTTHASTIYTDYRFSKDDMLLLGRESAGVPDQVKQAVDAGVKIAMHNGARSLNVALAASMILGEALRQTR